MSDKEINDLLNEVCSPFEDLIDYFNFVEYIKANYEITDEIQKDLDEYKRLINSTPIITPNRK